MLYTTWTYLQLMFSDVLTFADITVWREYKYEHV